MADYLHLILESFAAVIIGVIGYLLSRKDESQGREMTRIDQAWQKEVSRIETTTTADSLRLWNEHARDVSNLAALQIEMSKHPDRHEINDTIQQFTKHMDSRFDDLKLAIQSHISKGQ